MAGGALQIGGMEEPDPHSDRPERVEALAQSQPALNLPLFVTLSCVVLVLIHAALEFLATPQQRYDAIAWFSFLPARYGELGNAFPVPAARYWTPLTYSFLHGSWMHLWVNVLWMVVFASPLVQRLGAARTLMIAFASSLGGAALHYAVYPEPGVPVIGASAVVSGYMGAAARFAFQPPVNRSSRALLNVEGPALSLAESLSNYRFLVFFAVWFAINLIFGLGSIGFGNQMVQIAWQAHIGGFVAGLLMFSLVDRRRS